MSIKGISLFSGAGGMDVGFAAAGVDIVVANELNKDAADTYAANHQTLKLLRGDIRDYIKELSQYTGIDIVFGGPPCQGFSVAGKMDPNDERSQLIWRYLDVIEAVQPKLFVMENVKALGCLEKWTPIRDAYLKRTATLGYTCNYVVLNSADFGVPQKRERVFFIGCRGEQNFSIFLNELEKYKAMPQSLRELLGQLPEAGTDKHPLTCTARITLASNPVMRKSPYAGMIFNGLGRPMNLDSVSATLPASMGGNKTPIIDSRLLEDKDAEDWVKTYHAGLSDGSITPAFKLAPSFLRRLTIMESSRIQTFPPHYDFKGSKSSIYTQIGNAVPCKLAEAVAKSAIAAYL